MSVKLERMQKEGTPLIDGEQVTFLWAGKKAPRLRGDFCGWEEEDGLALNKVEPGLWGLTLQLPANGYFEYTFFEGDRRLLDPNNRRTTPNGMGKTNNYFHMPHGKPTDLTRKKRGVKQGTLLTVILEMDFTRESTRKVTFYQPPVAEPAPLLVVYDGSDYLRRARLPVMLDNLIAQKRIQPLCLALIPNGGKTRFLEYACGEGTLMALMGIVLPQAAKHLNLLDIQEHPGAFGVMGASMGGLMALYTGLRFPQVFGRVLAQSGAYSLRGFPFIVQHLVRSAPRPPLQIWMDCGKYEFLLQPNRQMHALLVESGYTVQYREYNAGHNYPAWRDDLWRGLEVLFPPLKKDED